MGASCGTELSCCSKGQKVLGNLKDLKQLAAQKAKEAAARAKEKAREGLERSPLRHGTHKEGEAPAAAADGTEPVYHDPYAGLSLREQARLRAGEPLDFDPMAEAKRRAEAQVTFVSNQRSEQLRKEKQEALKEERRLDRPAERGAILMSPEVALLGKRPKLVATGKAVQDSEPPEKDHSQKAVALRGMPHLEVLSDDQQTAIRCLRGFSPGFSQPNQDDFFWLMTGDSYKVCGLFDGHGRHGHKMAAIARDEIMRQLIENVPEDRNDNQEYKQQIKRVLTDAFDAAHTRILGGGDVDLDVALSGASACVVVYDMRRRWLSVAWIGNVRCVLGEFHEKNAGKEGDEKKKKSAKKLKAVPMTEDHTTRAPVERYRIEATGKADLREAELPDLSPEPIWEIYAQGESWPGIPLTRCLGNLVGQQLGLSSEPQVISRSLDSRCKFMVLGTDGFWSQNDDLEVIHLINECRRENVQYGMTTVVGRTLKKWERIKEAGGSIDDLTICAQWF